MSRPLITIHDLATETIETREMNDKEFAQWEIDQARREEELSTERAKATAKADLLEKLGITEDEAKLLLS